MPVQNSQFLKGEQVPSVSAKKKNLAIKNYAICTETSYLRFSERRHANFKCLETYFPPILAWVRFAWQKSLIKLFTLAVCVIFLWIDRSFLRSSTIWRPRVHLRYRISFFSRQLPSYKTAEIYRPTQGQCNYYQPEQHSLSLWYAALSKKVSTARSR